MELNNFICIDLNKLDIVKKERLVKKVKKECKLKNPKYAIIYNMGYPVDNIPYYLHCYAISNNILKIHRGYLTELSEFKLKFEDNMVDIPVEGIDIKFNPRKYQNDCIKTIIDSNEFQGYILAPCGSGKTFIAMQLMSELKQKTVILVHTTMLMEQWKRDILNNTTIKEHELGLFYGKRKKIGSKVTIAMVQSLNKVITKLSDKWGLVILDEMHKVPAVTFAKTVNNLKAKYRYGLTATLRRKDGLHILIPKIFGNMLYKVDEKDLTEKKIKNICVIRPTKFELLSASEKALKRNNKLKAIIKYAKQKGDTELERRMSAQLNRKFDYTTYMEEIVNDKQRNQLIISDVMKEVDNGHKCVIFCERVAHCIKLDNTFKKKGYKSMLIIGGVAESIGVKDIYKYADKLMNDDELDIIIGTPQCINESMSITILDRAFITNSLVSNISKIKQQKGRIERYKENKTAVTYYYWDKYMFDNPTRTLKKIFDSVKTR